MPITVTYAHTWPTALRSSVAAFTARHLLFQLFLFVGSAAAGVFVLNGVMQLLAVVAPITLLVVMLASARTVVRAGEQTITLTEEGFTASSPGATVTVAWSATKGVAKQRDLWVIRLTHRMVTTIPASAFTAEQAADMERLLQDPPR